MTSVVVDGREVRLTNLDKVLWPVTGLTKAALIDYYRSVAPVLLPHIADHPLTLHRFPDGVEGSHWYETRAPAHPPWVRTQQMYSFRSGKDVRAPVIDDLAALVWAANSAAIEIHPFLATTEDLLRPTVLVFDLDPGPGRNIVDAGRVALDLRARLERSGFDPVPKTSGRKGLHVYAAISGATFVDTKQLARAIAEEMARLEPDRVTHVMAKRARDGKVFVDWSQNDPGKSTVAPYSLRGLPYPTVSMPVRWEEVEAAVRADAVRGLVFLAGDVTERIERHGDLFAPTLTPST